jgi:hypothetical protein
LFFGLHLLLIVGLMRCTNHKLTPLNHPSLCRAEQTPVDEALARGHEHIVALINTYSAQRPDDAEDVPGDEEEAEEEAAQHSEAGEAGAMELENGAASPVQQQQQQQQQQTIDPGPQP